MSRILVSCGEAETEVKKSRFIANAAIVHSEKEVQDYLAQIRKKHYDAKHHCSAYILDGEPPVLHASDDGEPQGTAGRPILSVLEAGELRDVLVVVTRYFGGTLLGTGGLSRAYREAAALCIENSTSVERISGAFADITLNYTDHGKVFRAMEAKGYHLSGTEYGENVVMRLFIPEEDIAGFEKSIIDMTGGRAGVVLSEIQFFAEV